MKGIKARIRTDWQNLAHGQTRGIIITKKSPTASGVYFSGIKEGDTATITMHVEWRGVLSWGKWGGSASSLQIGLPYSSQDEYSNQEPVQGQSVFWRVKVGKMLTK